MEDIEIQNLDTEMEDVAKEIKESKTGFSFSPLHFIIVGIAIGFISNMFFQGSGETTDNIVNLIALIFILIGIIGMFKDQIVK